ncbi:MAG: signal peptidase I [Chloroflexi bacterium]|nr:signal peptidase I [Chloroflexota bacterium]
MKDDGEIEDELPSEDEEAAEAEQELQPDLPYDPLIEPWNDPTSTSITTYRLGQRRVADAVRPSATPSYPALPYPRDDDLSELRHRLRQGTVVVPRRRRAWSVTVQELVETLLLAMLIFFAIGGIPGRGGGSIQNFRVEGASMEPSLDSGEYLIVNKLAYAEIDLSLFDWLPFYESGDNPVHHLWDTPGRGDVIVFRAPTNLSRDFIKRIIGVPGDTVEIDRGTNTVRLNGEIIAESYIQGETTCSNICGPWIVPEGAYFVMGDNRQNSSDSRQGWFVPEENIVGKALITYWRDGGPEFDLAPNHKVLITSEAAAEE